MLVGSKNVRTLDGVEARAFDRVDSGGEVSSLFVVDLQ
jgi:hypothetical protein